MIVIEKIKSFFIFLSRRFKRYKKKTLRKYRRLSRPWQIVIATMAIILLAIPTFSFSRYVYTIVKDYINMTSTFFFKSDFLSEKNPEYTITNWSGVDAYTLTINMNSIKNELKKAEVDISYAIELECEDTVTCLLSKNAGIIYASDGSEDQRNRDSFTVTVTPKQAFDSNETTRFKVKTTSTSPYTKSISAEFVLKVEKVGISYEITDAPNSVYSVLRITNSVTYYTVQEAFGSYSVGDEIDSNTYNHLSAENKAKCASAILNLSFDPRVVAIDMTNSYYLDAFAKREYTTSKYHLIEEAFSSYQVGDLIDKQTYNSLSNANKNKCSDEYEYIDSFKIRINPTSSADIRFYKQDKNANYTYPGVNATSIITVS